MTGMSDFPDIVRPPCALPIVAQARIVIGADERKHLSRLADRLLADEPLLGATGSFGEKVSTGLGPWPSLVIEDHSAISLFEGTGNLAYSYRALLLAGEGDLVAIGVPRSPGFEAYCRDTLCLGRVQILVPHDAAAQSLTVRCANDPAFVGKAAEQARRAGGLNLVPYMGTGGAWMLAGRIAARSDTEVRVAAPPPRLTHRVNDKLWFAERVAEIFGKTALPPIHAIFGLAALCGRVAGLGKRHAAVGVKIPDSASSAGNIVIEGPVAAELSPRRLQIRLESQLRRAGWRGRFPLMVTAWELPLVASPSAQLWIPERGRDVIVEGLFDQAVMGTARVFTGAQPTSLSPVWQQRIAEGATRIGTLFQELGYFGRCSFDAILVGPDEASAELHWIECNGRWGGTSIPMTLANRLLKDWRRRPFVIIEREDLALEPRDFGAFLRTISEDLFLPGRRGVGAVLLAPGQVEAGTGFEIMVLGETLEAARAHAADLAERLTEESTPRPA